MSLKSSITVFTDVGVKDVDDELFLNYLYRTPSIENSMGPPILDIVFMGSDGVSPESALAQWKKYESHLLKKFSTQINENGMLVIQAPYVLKEIRYHTIDAFKGLKVDAQYVLQISPMNGYDGSNMTVEKKYVFAGDYITPEGARPSFNREGAYTILDRFHGEGKLVDISSAHMATMRFNKDLVSKFDGPFLDATVFTAFMLAFARMSPTHSANKFAEGLVNPAVGRGANYTSVMNIVKALSPEDTSISPENTEYAMKAAENYFKEIESTGIQFKDRESSVNTLASMNYSLQLIHQLSPGNPSDSIFKSGQVFVSNFTIDSIPAELQSSWELFKANADKLFESFNPVYDLYAGYILTGIINGKDRNKHTREEFLKNVVTEF
jgi:hypothetical protein